MSLLLLCGTQPCNIDGGDDDDDGEDDDNDNGGGGGGDEESDLVFEKDRLFATEGFKLGDNKK